MMPAPTAFPNQPDVVVIGGGSAGVAAAIAAARRGAQTLLVEHFGFLGGAGTASLVHSFCGLYELDSTRLSNGGLVEEFERRLREEGVAHGPVPMGRVHVLMHQPQLLAAFYDRWCAAESKLTVLLHTQVIRAEVEAGRVSSLTLHCRGRDFLVRPKAVVDASGDAVLAVLTQQPFEMAAASELQRPAYCVGVANVDAFEPLQVAGAIVQGIQEKKLPRDAAGAHFRSSGIQGEVFMTLDLDGGGDYDSTDPSCLTAVEMRGREIAFQVIRHLKVAHVAFREARISTLPVRAGIRESRRWVGEAVLTEDDILSSKRSESDVAYASWPIELRETARGPKLIYPHEAKSCGIPLAVLRAKNLRNVFTAGRCISATHRAQASTRVMGTALATGQAAGIAAASDLT